MSLDTHKAILRRFDTEILGAADPVAFKELVAPNVVDHNRLPGLPVGADGVWQLVVGIYRTAFPDLTVEVHDQIAEGDKVVTRKTLHGTHKGALMGIPATGKRVSFDVIDITRIANGKIVEHWRQSDMLGLMQQLGVIPQTA